MNEILPIALPGTHERFLSYFKSYNFPKNTRVLDLGAGHGAMSKKLFELGYDVHACDLFPELFKFTKIKCQKADLTQKLPYNNNSFDVVIAVEVTEHINDHDVFFREVNRILNQSGSLLISTPNILSLKSRIRFLWSGFYYSFKQLELHNYNGLQHVAGLTLDQYNYVAVKNGFESAQIEIDKQQKTSLWILTLWYPIHFLLRLRKGVSHIHNQKKLLTGRLLLLKFQNNKIIKLFD